MSPPSGAGLPGMDHVKSQDGTPIAYQRTGQGPVLVLVVGAFCDRTSTASLTPLLTDRFTVVEYDRRGRGDSGAGEGPGVDIDPAREVEDLAAVIEAAGGSAAVYGHSSGGALALEAAAAGLPVTRLAVYEPPYTVEPGGGAATGLLDAVRERLDAGDPDGAAVRFLEATGMPPQALAGMQAGPAWPHLRALAPALLHDLALIGSGRVPAARFAAVGCPTLVLSGGSDASSPSPSGVAVAEAVPGARHEVVVGQGHAVAAAAVAPVLLGWFGR